MANFNLKSIGVLWEALQRLANIPGSSWETVSRNVQRLVDDPLYRKQVYLAMTGKLVIAEITREEWVEREYNILFQLHELGLPVLHPSPHTVRTHLNAAYQEGFGLNHRFVPGGLTRQMLLDASAKAGIKIGTSHPSGEQLPTETGVFDCDLSTVLQPMDGEQRPFNLNYDEHEGWSKEQGGDSLSSVEEAQYLLLRMKLEFGRVLFMGGWIRCRNTAGSDSSVGVRFVADDGLFVGFGGRSLRSWGGGCLPRKFTALAS